MKYIVALCVLLYAHCLPVEPAHAQAYSPNITVYGPVMCHYEKYCDLRGCWQRRYCEQKWCDNSGCYTSKWWETL